MVTEGRGAAHAGQRSSKGYRCTPETPRGLPEITIVVNYYVQTGSG